jgi:hypothetical protein
VKFPSSRSIADFEELVASKETTDERIFLLKDRAAVKRRRWGWNEGF